MANYELVTIYAGSKRAFIALEKHFSDERFHFGYFDADENKAIIELRAKEGDSMQDIIDLSVFYPDIYTHVEVAYESERYEKTHKYNVINRDITVQGVIELTSEKVENTSVDSEVKVEKDITNEKPFAKDVADEVIEDFYKD